MRWIGQGCKRLAFCYVDYSCHIGKHEFGCGFVVSKRFRQLVSGLMPVNERIATIRQAILYNIRVICSLAPTEEKDNVVKDAFYVELKNVGPMTQKLSSEILMRSSDGKVSLAPLSHSSASTRIPPPMV